VRSPSIVVMGGAGMLGHKMFQVLHREYPGTLCTVRNDAQRELLRKMGLPSGSDVLSGVDVMDIAALKRLLAGFRPDVIVNCAGIIKQRSQAAWAIPSITVNSLLPHKLSEMANGWGGRVIHFSTDCVFSGRKGAYKEEDPSDAEDLYGKTKFLGEVAAPNALTIRTSIIGRELSQHRSLLDWFLSNNHSRVRGFSKVIFAGVSTNYLADFVARAIRECPTLSGLYQLASRPVSKHDLLCILRSAYGLDIQIRPDDSEISDRSLDAGKLARAIAFSPPAWPDLATQLAADPIPYEQEQVLAI
jgi:dTDP-4-dehydrorhamnose reductase